MSEQLLDCQEEFINGDTPTDITHVEMKRFGDWQPTNVFPSNLVYALQSIEGWFDPKERELTGRPAAVCGFGTSLAAHVEEIRAIKEAGGTVFTCSGAHDFLIERGVIPDYHSEIDWKKHKASFTSKPHKDVQYLISATCHPDTITNVIDYNAQLLFQQHGPEISYPDESLCIPCGYDAGQTAIIIAKILGYRDLHLFGFDYSFDQDMVRHAGKHGGRVHHIFDVLVDGRQFATSKTMFTALLTIEYMLRENPDLNVQVYGDALLINFLEAKQKLNS